MVMLFKTIPPILLILLATVTTADAASYTTGSGDASFRRINASGGKLTGVDVSGSLVTANGVQISLNRLALEAAAAAGANPPPSAASNLGQPNGAAELDNNGTLTGNTITFNGASVPLATIAGLAESALPSARLGATGGAAALDGAGTLSANTATATGAPLARSLGAHFADVINAADYGVSCDGATDNYAAITRGVIPAVNASRGGAEVDWPSGGKCLVSAAVTATITKNVLFRGRGPISTYFYFTSNTSNGFHLIANNGAAIEWEESGIDTAATSPSADALMIEGYNAGTGSLPHNNAGWVVVDHNQIQGNFWAGIHLRNLNFATVSYNRITASAGPAITSAYPSPNNLVADPAVAVIGSSANATSGTSVGTAGLFLEGTGSDYVIDPKVIGNSIVNGTAQIEIDDSQGGYMAANSLFNGTYGVRSACASGVACENFTFTTGYVFDFLDDFYLENMDGFQVTGNFMWVSGANSSYPVGGSVGVFVRDGNGGAVTGNTMQAPGPGSAPAIPQWAWFVGNDSPNSKPWVFGPNSIFGAGGPVMIGNDANTTGLSATGNTIAQAGQPASGTSIADATMTQANPYGGNDYVMNSTPYADVKSDGQGDLYLRRAFRCGGTYDTCTLSQVVNGNTVFQSDAGGNQTTTGQEQRYAGGGYREYTSVVFGTVASGGISQLTPAGQFPAFAGTAASAGAAASATTLTVANGAIFAAGMGLSDSSSGATATVASVSGNTLTLAGGGLTAAIANGDTLSNTLPPPGELGLGTLNVSNGTLTERNGYCVSGSTRFVVDLTQIYAGNAPAGAMTAQTLAGTLTSGLSFSAGRDANTGAPMLMLTNNSGAPYTCRFDETFASAPL